MSKKVNIILSLVIFTLLSVLIGVPLYAQSSEDYCCVIPLEFDNQSGSDIDRMLPIPVNANALLGIGVISTTTDDFFFTDEGGTNVKGFVQGLNDNGVNWWTHVFIEDGDITTNNLYTGGPSFSDGLPLNSPDYNDAHIEIPDSASLDILDDLDILIEIEADSPNQMCGILLEKSNLITMGTNRTGYALHSSGERKFSSAFTVAGSAGSQSYFFDFTPTDDIFICGVFTYTNGVANNNSTFDSVRIVGGDLDNDTALETITTFPLHAYDSAVNGLGWLYFDHAVSLTGGTTYRFLLDCTFTPPANCTNHNNTGASETETSDIGSFSISGLITHSIYGSYRGIPTNLQSSAGLAYLDGDDPRATFVGIIDNAHVQSSAAVWDGTRSTIRLTYASPTLDMELDSLNIASSALSEMAIGTNTNDVIVGRYFDGALYSLQIDSGVSNVFDLADVLPIRINEFQAGTTGNGWVWKSTITEDSASTNDAQYVLTSNITNININAGALAVLPTPTPQSTPDVLSGILNGLDFDPFHTPVPTVEPEIPLIPDPPNADIIQSEVYWLIVGFWLVTLAGGLAGRLFSDYTIALMFMLGFGLISAYAGAEFLLWLTGLICMGVTGMALIRHEGKS